ncbi:uncharacterized protein LOC102802688 [Saccoglossus kowalevskii]
MIRFIFSLILLALIADGVELNGGFRRIKYEDYEKLEVAAGWLDCERIILYFQSRRLDIFNPQPNIYWRVDIRIDGDGVFNGSDRLRQMRTPITVIYDKGFKLCKSYTVKWKATDFVKQGPSLYNITGQQAIKMPCKCKQSVIEMEPFKLQTMNGAKYTFPSQSEAGTRDYVFLRECDNPKTRISFNGSVTTTGSDEPKLDLVRFFFPYQFNDPHTLIMNSDGVATINGQKNLNIHDDHYAGVEWFSGSGNMVVVFKKIEVRVLWDHSKNSVTIAAGEEFSACGLLAYKKGKASDDIQQLPKEFVNEWATS